MKNLIYFDSAATSWPKPVSVIKAISNSFYMYGGNPGRSGHILSLNAAKAIYECREKICDAIEFEHPERVVFTYNTTYALNFAIKGLCKDNSHILISNLEHNSVLRPVYALSKDSKRNITYDVFDALGTKEQVLTNFKAKIKPSTNLAVITMASNVCGKVLPISDISKICKENSIKLIVDAAQSGGCVPISFYQLGADCICFAGHKSFYGPQGTGFCVFSKETEIQSLIQGGNGVDSKNLDMSGFLPEKLEAGTLSTPGICGLYQGIEYVLSTGIQSIYEKGIFLCDYLSEKLLNMSNISVYSGDFDKTPCIVFNKKNQSADYVSSMLSEKGICVRSGFHCAPLAHKALGTQEQGAVRISISHKNTTKEIDKFIDVLNKI